MALYIKKKKRKKKENLKSNKKKGQIGKDLILR